MQESAQIYTQSDVVQFVSKGVQPPSAVYLDLDDQLQITVLNDGTGNTITLRARILRPDGQITVLEQSITATVAQGTTVESFAMCEGFLLSVSASTVASISNQIPFFCNVCILRNSGPSANITMVLFSDYVTPTHPGGWTASGATQRFNYDGFPVMKVIATPPAGTDFSITPDAGQTWKVISIFAQFVTSTVGSIRQPFPRIDLGGNPVYELQCSNAVLASKTIFFTFTPNVINQLSGSTQTMPIPDGTVITAPAKFAITTVGLDAGDQWSNISIFYLGRYTDGL